MNFNNKAGVRKIRITLLIVGICWLMGLTTLIFFEKFTALAVLAGLFLLVAIVISLLNFQFVKITLVNNRLFVRYYSIFSVDRLFQMFDFPVAQLHNVEVKKYFFGLRWNVRFTVRVQRGLADYPPVSFSAISFSERERLITELRKIISDR